MIHDILHLHTFVSLINNRSNVPDDVVIELYEVDRPRLDVGVVQILGVLVEVYQLLLCQVDNLQTGNFTFGFLLDVCHHHSLVEILHRETEL